MQQWLNSYHTENTRSAAKKAVVAWNKYLDWKKIDENILVQDMAEKEDLKYHALADFKADYQKHMPVKDSTMKQYMAFLPRYLRVIHGIKIDRSELQIFTGKQKLPKTDRTPFTRDIIKRLCKAADEIHKTQYLVLSSSGQRISESLLNEEKNYFLDEEPARILIPAEITKTKKERITFLSREAVQGINSNPEYWEKRNLIQDEVYFNRLRRKVGLVEKYPNSVNYLYNLHSFRAFFRTEAGKINHDFAEKVLGHESFDTHYVRLTDEDKAKYYRKLEPSLKIF